MKRISLLLKIFEAKGKPEKVFILFGFVFGFLWVFLIPPTEIPDEQNHFKRVYQISEGNFVPTKKEGLKLEEIEPNLYKEEIEIPPALLGGLLPKDLYEVADFRYYYIQNHRAKYKRDYFKDYLSKSLNKEVRLFYAFPNTAMYNPISYFPQSSFVFFLNRIGDFSALTIFFAGRLGGFLFWFFAVYYSIKISPIFIWVLLLIALFPMTIFESISNSADTVSIASAFLFFAFVLDSMKNGVTNKKLTLIFILSIFLSLGKFIYFGIIPIFLLVILQNKSETKKLSIFLFFMFCFNLILIAFWGKLVQPYYVPLLPDVDPNKQLMYVLNNPFHYIQMVFTQFVLDIPMLIGGAVGILGWTDIVLPYKIYFFYWIAIIVISIFDGSEMKLPPIRKYLIPLLIFGIVFGFYLIQYLSWNPYQNKIIEGAHQGRYYIPLLPILLLLFYRENKSLNNYLKFILCSGIFLSLANCSYILLKVYYLK